MPANPRTPADLAACGSHRPAATVLNLVKPVSMISTVALALPSAAGVRVTPFLAPDGDVTVTGGTAGSRERRWMVSRLPSTEARKSSFQIGFLHQPMGSPAHQFGMRPSTIKAPRPKPNMITHKLGDSPLAHTVQYQWLLLVRPRHQRLAPIGDRFDLLVPPPQLRVLALSPGAPPSLGGATTVNRQGGKHQ